MTPLLLQGDAQALPLADNSIHSIICDPPYLIAFMGQQFDRQHTALSGNNPGQQMQAWHYAWALEALRVLKPGGYCLAFGGTRTHHRLMCALEDAGFEIRDTVTYLHDGTSAEGALFASLTPEQQRAYLEIHHPAGVMQWGYGSGFPKSLSVGKQLEKKIIAAIEAKGYAFTGWADES